MKDRSASRRSKKPEEGEAKLTHGVFANPRRLPIGRIDVKSQGHFDMAGKNSSAEAHLFGGRQPCRQTRDSKNAAKTHFRKISSRNGDRQYTNTPLSDCRTTRRGDSTMEKAFRLFLGVRGFPARPVRAVRPKSFCFFFLQKPRRSDLAPCLLAVLRPHVHYYFLALSSA